MDVFTIASPVTSGNVNLTGGTGDGAYARIFGDPDVGSLLIPLSVGGAINMNTGMGSGAYARIESASVNSIHVDFTGGITSGGFFVNGAEGALSSGDSGFFAGGQSAVAGQNFFVTYSGGTVVPSTLPTGVQTAIDQVVVATNQQTMLNTTTSNNTSEGEGGDPKDEKERKQLPICGK
jgi:hypothetical protein